MEWTTILCSFLAFNAGVLVGIVLTGFLSVPVRADLEQENWTLRQLLKARDDQYGDDVLEHHTLTHGV
jgi:hypothetical protein